MLIINHMVDKKENTSSMKKTLLIRLMPLAAGLALLSGCIVEAPPVQSPEAPPPPVAEVVPMQPEATFAWTPGYWDWRGHWVWMRGYWAPPPHPGAVWVQGGWVQSHGQYVWVHPHWR